MSKDNELFVSMPVGKAVAKLAIPTVISQIIVILYSMADTFFIGQTGDPNQLAALSIAFPIYTVLTAVANLFGIGANSLIARSMGQNDEATAKKASSFCFWGSIVATAILCLVLAIFMKPILMLAGADDLTFRYTADYLLYVFVIGGIPTVAGLALGHLVRAIGRTREAGVGLAIGGILNIILDPIFVLVFDMGVSGAAIATAISNTVSLIFFLVVLFKIRGNSCLTLSLKQFTMKRKVSLGILSVGFPAAISVLLVCFSISLLTALILRHENGNIIAAAYGVTAKCGTIALHISIGIAQGVMPLIGYSYGAKDHKRVREVTRLAFIILWIFSIAFLVLVQLIPDLFIKMFIDDAATIAVGGEFIRRWSWCAIGMCLVAMYDAIFQAVGKWKTSLWVAVIRFIVAFPAFCFILDALFGVQGLMWVQPIADTIALLLAAVLFRHFKKTLSKHAEQQDEIPAVQPTTNRIVTISREFGSGGRTIGKEVAAELGIPCYDSELIEKISVQSGFAKEYVEKYGEDTISDNLYENALAGRTPDGQSDSDKLWFAQKKVISDLASKGPCVIVGRCADYILRDLADCLTVFIHASDEKRADRIVSVYGQRDQSPMRRIQDKDKKRKAYYEIYTGTEWGKAANYDLCLDSGVLGIDQCVKTIKELY